jgi:putative glutamine amidotransferase
MSRPMIGVCAAVEPASFGVWVDEPVVLLPLSYARALQQAGAIVAMLPPDSLATEAPDEILERLDGLVLGGGADVGANPERDAFEIALARRALERDLPLLGVCRGMQILNVASGGTLEQHLPSRLGHEDHRPVPGVWAEHEVRLAGGSLAARAAGAERLSVKSHHHQGVADLGEGLQPSAWADDGETIEAIESDDGRSFALGVLWHPEEAGDDQIVPALVDAAGG